MEFPNEGAGVLDQITAMRTIRKVEVNNANCFLPEISVTIKESFKPGARSHQATLSKVSVKRKELEFSEALPDWVKSGCLIILESK
jgi:hypothetical protein